MQTSDVRGAGTDSDVTITVFGDKGDTGARALESSANVGNVAMGTVLMSNAVRSFAVVRFS